MTSRDRVLTALQAREPDRVPYCEIGIDRQLAEQLLGWERQTRESGHLEEQPYSAAEEKMLADHLALDDLFYVLRAPVFAERLTGTDGRQFYGEGEITTRAELDRLRLPDPTAESTYTGARDFLAEKGDRAAFVVTRIGIFPTLLSMGWEAFSLALFEERDLLEEILDCYTDWTVELARRAGRIGFDVFVSTDDMAFRTGTFFSPEIFRTLIKPRFRRVAEQLDIPWVVHSDGDVSAILDDLVDLGISGLHPIERNAMDIRSIKRRYGKRLCLLGNVDLDLLGRGTADEVEQEVRELIRDVAPDGGYIVTSGNSLASYVKPENARALARAVQHWGAYPLKA